MDKRMAAVVMAAGLVFGAGVAQAQQQFGPSPQSMYQGHPGGAPTLRVNTDGLSSYLASAHHNGTPVAAQVAPAVRARRAHASQHRAAVTYSARATAHQGFNGNTSNGTARGR